MPALAAPIAAPGMPIATSPAVVAESGAPAPAWVMAQIADAARTQLKGDRKELTIVLDPPELGAIHIKVSTRGGEVLATIQTVHHAVREILDARLPELRQTLADAGLRLDQCTVSMQTQAEQGRHQQAHREQPYMWTPPRPNSPPTQPATPQAETTPHPALRVSQQLVDYLA